MNNIDYDSLTEAEQLELIKDSPFNIKYFKNPSEAVQLAAVTDNGYSIRYIKNPSEAIHNAAVLNIAEVIVERLSRELKNSDLLKV